MTTCSAPLQESDLIFSSFSSTLRTTLSELKRTNLSIKNRLRSIKQDSEYVSRVSDAYQLPLVANERCGSWYIVPEKKAGSAYFKSTDGHFGQWAFSLRRLNLQVLDVVEELGGYVCINVSSEEKNQAADLPDRCIIVDSTRRGKIMPDALSKTVPIWIYVMNRLLFPNSDSRSLMRLSVPLYAVSESEYAQIAARLEGFVNEAKALQLDLEPVRTKLQGLPMRVTWVKPDETLPATLSATERRNLIVLCTASNQTSHETSTNSEYVQGAADDPESWSLGLDAKTFWRHHDTLLSTSEDDLPNVIEELMSAKSRVSVARSPVLIRPTANIFIANNAALEMAGTRSFHAVVSCTTQPDNVLQENLGSKYVTLKCAPGKVGSRQLRKELEIARDRLTFERDAKMLITCDTGNDLAVGVALALLCLCFTDQGLQRDPHKISPPVNKTLIRQRLSWIMTSMPDASPSRATLQSVNAFLMG